MSFSTTGPCLLAHLNIGEMTAGRRARFMVAQGCFRLKPSRTKAPRRLKSTRSYSALILSEAGKNPLDAALASEGAQASEASPAATKHDAPTAAGHESETGAVHPGSAAASTAGDEGDRLDDTR